MANEQNLIPLNKRTKEEQRAIAQKGGKKSGEVRREKKTFRQLAETLLSLEVTDAKTKKEMKELGIEENEFTQKTLCTLGLIAEARDGNVRAFEKLQELTGEIEQDNNKEVLDKLDKVLGGIDAIADEQAEGILE